MWNGRTLAVKWTLPVLRQKYVFCAVKPQRYAGCTSICTTCLTPTTHIVKFGPLHLIYTTILLQWQFGVYKFGNVYSPSSRRGEILFLPGERTGETAICSWFLLRFELSFCYANHQRGYFGNSADHHVQWLLRTLWRS